MGGYAPNQYCTYVMQWENAETSHSFSASKTVILQACSGIGNAVKWSWSVIDFSLITIIECPSKQLSRKHFCNYHRQEEGLLDSREVRQGVTCKTQSWSLPFAHPLLFVPMGHLGDSGLLPELLLAAETALQSGHIYTCYILMYVKLWKTGRFTPYLCHQNQSYAQSGQQQALWLHLW